MLLALALALQAETAAPASPVFEHIDFDLARYRMPDLGAQSCHRDNDASAITICGRRGGAYPLARMERIYGPQRLIADTQVAGSLRGGFHAEAVNLDPTATDSSLPHDVSSRVMVGLRLPF